MKLYTKVKRKKRIKDFVRHLYLHEGSSAYDYGCAQTYFDEEFCNLENKIARRSFSDLFTITKTEYPSTTKKILASIIFDLFRENFLMCLYCPDIRKIVFYRDNSNRKIIGRYINFYYNYSPPGGNFDYKGVDGYSYLDIVKLANQELNCKYE